MARKEKKPKAPILKNRKLKSAPHRVFFDAWKDGKLIRDDRSFKRKEDAKEFHKQKLNDFLSFGASNYELTLEDRYAIETWQNFKVEIGTDFPVPSLLNIINEKIEQINMRKSSMTLNSAITNFLESKKGKVGDYHYRDLKSHCFIFQTYFKERISFVCDLNKKLAKEWLNSLDVESQTLKHYNSHLKTFYNYCISEDLADLNPFLYIKIDVEFKNPAIYTPEEIRKLILNSPPELQLSFYLQCFCGVRSSEVRKLRWEDIDLRANTISISRKTAKTKIPRKIKLLPKCNRDIECLKGQLNVSNDTALLISCSKNKFYKLKTSVHEETKIPPKFNAFRHAFCSYHFEHFNDWHLNTAMAGHSKAVFETHYKDLVEATDASKWISMIPLLASKTAEEVEQDEMNQALDDMFESTQTEGDVEWTIL